MCIPLWQARGHVWAGRRVLVTAPMLRISFMVMDFLLGLLFAVGLGWGQRASRILVCWGADVHPSAVCFCCSEPRYAVISTSFCHLLSLVVPQILLWEPQLYPSRLHLAYLLPQGTVTPAQQPELTNTQWLPLFLVGEGFSFVLNERGVLSMGEGFSIVLHRMLTILESEVIE